MTRWLLLSLCLGQAACWGSGAQTRRFYALSVEPADRVASSSIAGLVRVRTLDAESTYDKFQIVVRQNPYELEYRELDVWAVKPGRMVSDLLARTLLETKTFESVTRELGERRPDYMLSGDLHALEIYDSDDVWYAHLSLSLSLTRFDTGESLWTFSFDERKLVQSRSFAHASRALSELLTTVAARTSAELTDVMLQRDGTAPAPQAAPAPATPPDAPVMIPETRR